MPYNALGQYYQDANPTAGAYGGFAATLAGPSFVPAGSSGGGSMQASDALAQYNADQQQRYDQIIQGFDSIISQSANFSTQTGLDVAANYQGFNSQIQQDLVSRGLGGTTIAPTMALGVQREHEAAQNRLRDQLIRQQADLQGNKLGFMERDMARSVPPQTGGYRFWGGGSGLGGGLSTNNINPASATGKAMGASYNLGGITGGGVQYQGTSGIAPKKKKQPGLLGL